MTGQLLSILTAILLVLINTTLLTRAITTREEEETFLTWCRTNGAVFDEYLEWPVDFPSSGRGVRARKTIFPNESFLFVPALLVLNFNNALKRDKKHIHAALIDSKIRPFDRMVLVLMKERVTDSFWAPYLNILPPPENKKHLLLSWSLEELAELENENIVEQRDVLLQEIAVCYATCMQFLEEESSPLAGNASLFHWAFHVLASRSFQLGDTDEYNLIPLADLLNHHPMSSVSWKVNQQKIFQMTLLGQHEIKANTEVFNHYGDLTSDRMLLDYSFASEENFLDVVTVEMPLDLAFLEDKRDVWDGSELDLDHFTKIGHFMEFFRIVSAENLSEKNFFQHPFSFENEKRAFDMCIRMLSERCQSLQSDLLLLTEQLPERLRMAVTYRVARKRIFAKYVQFCKEAQERFLSCSTKNKWEQQNQRNFLGRYHRELQQMSRSKVFAVP